MPPKRTSTSEAPAMTQAAIRKLVADSVTAALEAQAATMANANNTNCNTPKLGRSGIKNSSKLRERKSIRSHVESWEKVSAKTRMVNPKSNFSQRLDYEEEQNQPGVIQELLLKLMNDLQSLKGSQQEKKETTAQSFTPYWDVSMIDDEEARNNFLKDVCTFLRKFSRIPFGITRKVILIA
ncbi:hypothetical protein Tco_0642211, partial [Tanacetum coccineum]